jgi:hypothetical protein
MQVPAYLSPAYLALGALGTLIFVQVCIRLNYARKVRAIGGVHAPGLAKDPISGTNRANY